MDHKHVARESRDKFSWAGICHRSLEVVLGIFHILLTRTQIYHSSSMSSGKSEGSSNEPAWEGNINAIAIGLS